MTHHNHPVCNVILPRYIAQVVLLTGAEREPAVVDLYVHTVSLPAVPHKQPTAYIQTGLIFGINE